MMEANEAHVGENGNNNGENNHDSDDDNYNSEESGSDVDSRGSGENESDDANSDDDTNSDDTLGIDVYEDEEDREAFELQNGTLEQIAAARKAYKQEILPIKHNDRNVWYLDTTEKFSHLSNEGWERLGGFVARNTHLEYIRLFASCRLTEEKVARFFSRPFDQFPPISRLEIIGHADRPLLGPEIVESLTPVLGMVPLRILHLAHVNLSVGGAAMQLSSALASCRLDQLYLRNAQLDDEASGELVSALDSSRLKELYLAGNRIGRIGCEAIVPLLTRGNTLLQELHLADNLLDDDCLRVLCESLENNSKLGVLTLDGNGAISDMGWKSVSKLVFDTTSLDSLYCSNLKLRSIGEIRADENPIINDIRNALRLNMSRGTNSSKGRLKIVKYLKSGGGLNMEPLNNVDLKLMPHVLAWIGRHCGQNAFHLVLRHWKMPVLYSFPSAEPNGGSRMKHPSGGPRMPVLEQRMRGLVKRMIGLRNEEGLAE